MRKFLLLLVIVLAGCCAFAQDPSPCPPSPCPPGTRPPSTWPPSRSQSQPPDGARMPTSSSPSSSRAAGSRVNPPGSSPTLATTTHRARRRNDLIAGRLAIERRGHLPNSSELQGERRKTGAPVEQQERVPPNDATWRDLHDPGFRRGTEHTRALDQRRRLRRLGCDGDKSAKRRRNSVAKCRADDRIAHRAPPLCMHDPVHGRVPRGVPPVEIGEQDGRALDGK